MGIEKETQGIFPLKDVHIKKVKILKKPKFDIAKLMEMHSGGDDAGVEMLRPEEDEAKNVLTASVKKVKLCIEEVQGRNCLTDFHALELTRDKQQSLIRKWHTLIEAHGDVKTTDGYLVRLFCLAFTKKQQGQERTNCYAQTAQIRKIRKKMTEIMINEVNKVQLRDFVKKLIPESIGKQIENETQGIFPLKDVHIKKVKITKLMELHTGGDDAGVEMVRPELDEAKNLL